MKQNCYTNTKYLLPCLTAGAAHLPGDQILCGVVGGEGIHILAGSSAQKPWGTLDPAEDQLLVFCTSGTLPLLHKTANRWLPKPWRDLYILCTVSLEPIRITFPHPMRSTVILTFIRGETTSWLWWNYNHPLKAPTETHWHFQIFKDRREWKHCTLKSENSSSESRWLYTAVRKTRGRL